VEVWVDHKHCSKGAQPVLKTVYRSSCRDKHSCQRRDSNLSPLTLQSDVLTTRLLRPAAATRPTLMYYLTYTHTHTRLTALCLGVPGWAGTRKVKPIWILLKPETVSGNGIGWAICKSAPRSRQITTPAPHYSSFFTGRMPFLLPNQQRQSTEGNWHITWHSSRQTASRSVQPFLQLILVPSTHWQTDRQTMLFYDVCSSSSSGDVG